MSGLQDFLAPFTHLLFANRNLDIVVLCFVLFGVAIYALNNHWRADRLEREAANSRSTVANAPTGRRYASAPMVEEIPQEAGGLPPVKGGRTYARNLGSALQKAGMSGPQIYSPPTPSGFAPNTNPMQPGGQPGMHQPYAPPPTPWAAPAAPAPAPWAFPAGQGRNVPGAVPGGNPFYQPQPGPPPSQVASGFPSQPAPTVATPGGYPQQPGGFPPQPSGPFTPPPFGVPTNGPAAPPPMFAPPGAGPMVAPPGVPTPATPGFSTPSVGQPAAVPEPADGGRRGKPKRRRFNFNVLENLEKMVQSKPAEPTPATGWTPPAAPAPPVTSPAPAAGLPASPAPPSQPVATPAGSAKTESAPTLPFLFTESAAKPVAPLPAKEAQPAPVAAEESAPEPASLAAESSPTTDESSATDEPVAIEPVAEAPAAEPVVETPAIAAAEPEAEAEREASQTSRRSMRSMMFGEEIAAGAPSPTEAPEPAVSDEKEDAPVEAPAETAAATDESGGDEGESTWPSYPWAQRAEASSSIDSEAAEVGEEARLEAPEIETSEPAVEPWRSSTDSDADRFESESSADEPAEPAVAEPSASEAEAAFALADSSGESSGTAAPSDDNTPSAGTLVIIEDDQTAASYYETLFKSNGYDVEVANDGVSGVDLCVKVQPQVILLDVMMPRQNGILVLQTLRASDETKNTPVVVMSNFSEPTLIKRALQLGALEYVIKTQVEGPALLNALPRWMNREKAFAAA